MMSKAESTCRHCGGPSERTICDECRCDDCGRLVILCECSRGGEE